MTIATEVRPPQHSCPCASPERTRRVQELWAVWIVCAVSYAGILLLRHPVALTALVSRDFWFAFAVWYYLPLKAFGLLLVLASGPAESCTVHTSRNMPPGGYREPASH